MIYEDAWWTVKWQPIDTHNAGFSFEALELSDYASNEIHILTLSRYIAN